MRGKLLIALFAASLSWSVVSAEHDEFSPRATAQPVEFSRTFPGWTCLYEGTSPNQIVRNDCGQACNKVCAGEAVCVRPDGRARPVRTQIFCMAVNGVCPGASACLDDPNPTIATGAGTPIASNPQPTTNPGGGGGPTPR